jgi:DNA repair exonuclease SbcCD nuclease subunit
VNAEGLDGIRVVVAHGNAGELMAEEGGFPILTDTPQRTHAEYVALGHWHSTVQFRSNGAVRMAYSGTHETTRFGEADSGNVLLVTIPEPGAPPEVSVRRVGGMRWYQVGTGEMITAPGKLAEIARTLAQIADPQNSLVEVALSGLLLECDRDEIAGIESLASRFLHARIDRSKLRPAPNDEAWIENLPTGAIRMGASRVQKLAGVGGDAGEIATEALLNLYTFAHEVRQ